MLNNLLDEPKADIKAKPARRGTEYFDVTPEFDEEVDDLDNGII